MIRADLSEQDILNDMLELALYLSEHEDDANVINITINRNGKSLHMHFEAYTEDGVEE